MFPEIENLSDRSPGVPGWGGGGVKGGTDSIKREKLRVMGMCKEGGHSVIQFNWTSWPPAAKIPHPPTAY
jgi:hypothetical protein